MKKTPKKKTKKKTKAKTKTPPLTWRVSSYELWQEIRDVHRRVADLASSIVDAWPMLRESNKLLLRAAQELEAAPDDVERLELARTVRAHLRLNVGGAAPEHDQALVARIEAARSEAAAAPCAHDGGRVRCPRCPGVHVCPHGALLREGELCAECLGV